MARCFIGAFPTSCEHKTTVLESSCVTKVYLRGLEDVVDRKSSAPVKDWNSEDIQLPWGMSNNSRSSYWEIKTTCSKYHFHLCFLVVTWWFTLRTHFDVLIKNLLQRSILNSFNQLWGFILLPGFSLQINFYKRTCPGCGCVDGKPHNFISQRTCSGCGQGGGRQLTEAPVCVCVCLILGRATHLYASSLKSTEQVKNRAMKQNIARFCGWLTYSYVCLPLRPFTHIMYRLWPSSKFIWTFIICMLNEAAYILVNNLYNSCKKHTKKTYKL